ncbi:hypothetical protein BS78_05G009100 [Paspalum vaginatum]|nr:hypothetical protein BS78_05G009100 [Paspalum vaginatum]
MSSSNQTAAVGLCQTLEMVSRIANLTASYGDKGEELNMVSAPAVVPILIVLFLGGVFNVSAVLSPTYRSLLSSALALSLPVMSYLFSEANKGSSSGLSCR